MPKKFYTINAKANGHADVLIYGDIGESWFGESVAAKDFVREIAALDVATMNVRINSNGGSVSDGIAIYNAIKRHPAQVNTVNDSVAASIASLILMAGDTREMAENALLMVHAPWGSTFGNANDMREYADILDVYAKAMSTSYASATGKTETEILDLLNDGKDHFYTAAEAVEFGFVDSIGAPLAMSASLDRNIIASHMKSLPFNSNNQAAAAASQSQEIYMSDKDINAAAQANAAATDLAVKAAVQAAALAETTRRADIKALATGSLASNQEVQAILTKAADDSAITVDAARAQVLAALSKDVTSIAGGYVSVDDNSSNIKAAKTNALLIRAGLAKNDTTNPFRGETLYEMAKASLAQAGVKTNHLDRMGVVASAFTHSTSDFTNLLADVANKSMLKGYEEAEETFQSWTGAGVLSDFKPTKRVDLNTFPSLLNVPEGAEYKYATIGDRGETTQLATYGRMFSITRQAIINDDLQAFTKIPRAMGRAAIRTVGDLVYAILTGNPVMSDGVTLFNATHTNLNAAGAISTTSVDAMIAAMAKQKDATGSTLNISLAKLIVPVSLRGLASQVANSEFEVGAANKNNTTPNFVRGLFEVIADARLDVASASNWYGVANSNIFDTIEVSYLDGNQTPTLEQENGWTVDGVEFKVRMDAGVKALDWRTLAKNPN